MTAQNLAPEDRLAIEREREERASSERLRRAARRPPAANLEAGLALIRTAEALRAAFESSLRR